jgi:hypothetical protein
MKEKDSPLTPCVTRSSLFVELLGAGPNVSYVVVDNA